MSGYEKFMSLVDELTKIGHTVYYPDVEFKVNDDTSTIGAFFDSNGGVDEFPHDHEVWKLKGEAITKHFRKIDQSDAILVTNYEKKGIENYIGGNTFLEIGYAFGTGKKVYILHDLPTESAYKEEILGMRPHVLQGDISNIV
jgi:nucleoside 2-deoxyribosyltransferase